ncbi:hypothetical protein SteCoe_5604 [Stentor coeruleus]|uniref:Uncharacterized protein n=1 Tax=Stentor coeruleus TaxID=5963 RepID=A0A1R2CS20_9CILI|nr:hypothetical protein SteCoe_5604 [Stentor coeruleus]
MEQLHKALIGFFVEFIASHNTNEGIHQKLISTIMKKKYVQKIIIKCMCKLEPIINDQIIVLNNPKSRKSSSQLAKQSKLLTLAQDIKNVMSNYDHIQGKISNMLDIVESIDFNVDHVSPTKDQSPDKPNALVTFLSSLVHNKRITNDEIEEISEETWSKHMEVEKMLKLEMEKYYNQIDALEQKYLTRLNHYKTKAGLKIDVLEKQNTETWQTFRLLLDRSQMMYEDKISKEYEEYKHDQDIIDNSHNPDFQIKDYSSAVQKIKNLFVVRNVLEKRKLQDEKLAIGLQNKISVFSEKINELKDMNGKLLENATSLTWCFETLVKKFDFPVLIKEKLLRLSQKQKCQKLEAIFRVDEIFEKYSLDTVSHKFDELKEGIANVSEKIKDENIKIRLNKLVIESKLQEIVHTEAVKSVLSTRPSIQPPSTTSSTPTQLIKKPPSGSIRSKLTKDQQISIQNNNSRTNQSPKLQNPLIRETIKKESALERMRKEMYSIDEEIMQVDKILEESLGGSSQTGILSTSDISSKDDDRRQTGKGRNSKYGLRLGISPKSSEISKYDMFSFQNEEIHKEDREMQTVFVEKYNQDTQVNLELYVRIWGIMNKGKKKTWNEEVYDVVEIDGFLYKATEFYIREKTDKNIQTDKESGLLDFSTPNNSIIRGIMSRLKIKKSERQLNKTKLDASVSENLIIKKFGINEQAAFKIEPKETPSPIDNHPTLSDKSIQNDFTDLEMKPSNSTSPIPSLQKISNSLLETKILKLQETLTSNSPLNKSLNTTPHKNNEQKIESLKLASQSYKKEFDLHTQIKGLKKMGFPEVQKLWEDVINRRILEGEKDKISVYLRGYLGTDKFDSEKNRIIGLLETSKSNNKDLESLLSNDIKMSKKLVENWKRFMMKLFEKSSFNFKKLIENSDSPREILYKAAKCIKHVKHRIAYYNDPQAHHSRKSPNKHENLILYSTDKWSVHSTSISPLESVKASSRFKFTKKLALKSQSSRSKTPFKDKIFSDTPKLPYI